jgi:hypothetical protein
MVHHALYTAGLLAYTVPVAGSKLPASEPVQTRWKATVRCHGLEKLFGFREARILEDLDCITKVRLRD